MIEQYLETHGNYLKHDSSSWWGINLALGHAYLGQVEQAQQTIRRVRANAMLENTARPFQYESDASEQTKKRVIKSYDKFHQRQMAILAILEKHLDKMPTALAEVESDPNFQQMYSKGKNEYRRRLEGKRHKPFGGMYQYYSSDFLDNFDRNAEGVTGVRRQRLAKQMLREQATQFGNMANDDDLNAMAQHVRSLTAEKMIQEKQRLTESYHKKSEPAHWVAQGAFLHAAKSSEPGKIVRLARVLKEKLQEQGASEEDARTISKLLTETGAEGHPRLGYLLQYKWLKEQKKKK